MFKQTITAASASWPYNSYDSMLEMPSGADPNENAWLTLQSRVKLNFVDSKHTTGTLPGQIVNQGGKWCARDTDGYLFPMLDWPPFLKTRFMKEFRQRAEKTWNWQFVLVTPKTYSELDYISMAGSGWKVRPNVLCLFRLSLFSDAGIFDSSPAAGPLRFGTPHRTINVFNLALNTQTVKLAPGITVDANHPATRTFSQIDGLSFRSNADLYDDSDLFKPAWWNKEHNVVSNTVSHEIGHALGQCHIMGLKGNPQYALGAPHGNDTAAYGVGSSDPLDSWNIMGGGDRVYLLNAVSWSERIFFHTSLAANKWLATGIMTTPPRKIPGSFTKDLEPAEW